MQSAKCKAQSAEKRKTVCQGVPQSNICWKSREGAAVLAKAGSLPARKGSKAGWEEVSNLEEKGVRTLLIGHDKVPQVKEKGYKLMEEIIVRKQLR